MTHHQPKVSLVRFLRTGMSRMGILLFAMVFAGGALQAQTLLAGWDFQTTSAGGTAAAAAPSSPTLYTANIGSGTLYLNGTNGSSTWTTATSGNQLTAFSGTAVNAGTGFSTVTTSPACIAVVNNTANGKAIVFKINMTNYANLIVSYATQATSTGFTTQQWDASTDGSTWTALQTVTSIPTSFATKTLPAATALNNAATAYLRVTFTGATNSSGNNRIDNVQMNATLAIPPVVTSDTAYGTYGVAFSHTILATNSPSSYAASNMPAWMTLAAGSGVMSGMPNAVTSGTLVNTSATNNAGTGTGTTLVIIGQASQSISFPAFGTVTYGDAPITLNATGGASGNAVTYASSNSAVASVSGNILTINGAGTTVITASQTGNVNYAAATSVTQTLVVNKQGQTITFGALNSVLTTDPPFTLSATGGASGNPVTYVSSNPAVANVSGSTVTMYSAGSTVITASQAGDVNYLAASPVSQTLVVNQGGLIAQTITFNTLPIKTYGDAPFGLTATGGGSGNPVTYSSSNTSVATVSGNTVTILAPGSTDITASQAGTPFYSAANSVTQTLYVGLKNLTLPNATANNKTYDGTTAATLSNLGLSGVVNGDLVGVAGGGNFAAPDVNSGIAVTSSLYLTGQDSYKYNLLQPGGLSADITPASQTITFGTLPTKTYGNAPFSVSATGGASGNPVTFSSNNPLVATVSGNIITITGAGTATITASQAASQNYAAATNADQLLIVNMANQTITFPAITNKVVGQAPFVLGATSTSGLPIQYSSSNPLVATVTDSIVTIVGAGTTTITANQSGNTNYFPANPITRSLTVTYPIIAAWDFFGQSSPATFAATTFNANLVSTGNLNLVTRGPLAVANTAANSFRTTAFKNDGITTGNQDYFQTTLKAKPGFRLNLGSITANFAGTASFAAAPGVSSQFAYSLDGSNFTLIGTPFVTTGTPATSPVVDLTGLSDLQHVHASKTVTIRYYASGQTTTGGWGYFSSAAGTNGLAFGGSADSCMPYIQSSNVTVCASALPYQWGSQSLSSSGTYTQTYISAGGCDSTYILNLTVDSCNNKTLQLKCFIQGYYQGSSSMQTVLVNQGIAALSTSCDSIDVELRDANAPYTMLATTRVILDVNGNAVCTFPNLNASYYIVVKHRNAIQTWSASPVSFAAQTISYDFTTAATQAYGDNEVEVDPGIFAVYSGDVVEDENIDLIDLGMLESDISSFSYGYLSTDLNGDGNVDLLDTGTMELNISNFVFSNHP